MHTAARTPLSAVPVEQSPGEPASRAFRVTAQPRGRRPAKWPLGGRDALLPTLRGMAGDLCLQGDTCPPGTVWGVGGRGGCGGLLNGGTEIQEFQDDVPEAINQMPIDEWLL